MKLEDSVSTKTLLEIDDYIDRLVKKIELLNYVNPINVESEKERFFSSKYLSDPKFVYPSIDFDRFYLHREFFSIKLEFIQDVRLRQLYEEIIYFYSGLVQSI